MKSLDEIKESISKLPAEERAELMEWMGVRENPGTESVWQTLSRFGDTTPSEQAATLPEDGAIQHDHYLYGSPKK